jgi:lysophospholipase L1-like esterase
MNRLVRSFLALAASAVLGCGGTPSVAVAQQEVQCSPVYLACGDSVPFGFNSGIALPPPNDNVFDATAFPWYLAQRVDLPLVNAACEGQTSDGFVTYGASDRGCFEFREQFPQGMHVDYAGSQLDFALGYLSTHPRVRVVTLMIGANDLQLAADACAWDPSCIQGKLPATLGNLARNVVVILRSMRAVSSDVPIVVENYYTPYPPGTPYGTLIELLNGTIAWAAAQVQEPAVAVADVHRAFLRASEPFGGDPCAAGLLERHPDGSCGVHPSPAGARLIADTIAPLVPPWTGKP